MILTPGQSLCTEIALETRAGHPIPNSQSHELTDADLSLASEYDKKYIGVTPRTPPNPIYNCHGLTFASSRTWIYDASALRMILKDDGYTEVARDDVLPGDVVLYYGDYGDIEHSGIVVSKPDEHFHIPFVVSKWGKLGERVHAAYVKPDIYGNDLHYYRITKWN